MCKMHCCVINKSPTALYGCQYMYNFEFLLAAGFLYLLDAHFIIIIIIKNEYD